MADPTPARGWPQEVGESGIVPCPLRPRPDHGDACEQCHGSGEIVVTAKPSRFSDPTPAEDDEGICGEAHDHDTRTTYEDEDGYQWECRRCGAEGWHDAEPQP